MLLFLPLFGNTQNIGAGVSGLYNFQAESFGAGARLTIFPDKTLSFSPQFSYFFVGPVSEITGGLSLEFKALRWKMFNFYLMLHGGYNRWTSYENSALKGASPSNWNAEGGVGIATNTCLRPFIEYRYNLKFQETHLQLGLLYVFGCKDSGNGYRDSKRMKKGVVCPSFK